MLGAQHRACISAGMGCSWEGYDLPLVVHVSKASQTVLYRALNMQGMLLLWIPCHLKSMEVCSQGKACNEKQGQQGMKDHTVGCMHLWHEQVGLIWRIHYT